MTRIGAQGDGIAEGPAGRLYIPLTVAGDRLRARPTGRRGDGFAADMVELLEPGPDRTLPPCPHYGRCGGCSLQHLSDDAYARWKIERLTDALGRFGVQGYVLDALCPTPPGARRRATFAAYRPGTSESVIVGFQVAHSHAIVDLEECPVLQSDILELLPTLRSWLPRILLPRQRTEVAATATDSGLDVVLALPGSPDLVLRQTLAEFAAAANLARLCVSVANGSPEPVVQRRPVGVRFGAVMVPLPPGSFLQPSRPGEAALVAKVIEALGSVHSASDLFSGAGTFTFALAEAGLRVHAVDADSASVQAIRAAGLPRVSCEVRDLFARPLRADELNRFDAVVFDPPRAGARAQAEQLALSAVPLAVAISCNPETFARDASILTQGGFRVVRITPIDQFLWSAHLEVAAVFRR